MNNFVYFFTTCFPEPLSVPDSINSRERMKRFVKSKVFPKKEKSEDPVDKPKEVFNLFDKVGLTPAKPLKPSYYRMVMGQYPPKRLVQLCVQ